MTLQFPAYKDQAKRRERVEEDLQNVQGKQTAAEELENHANDIAIGWVHKRELSRASAIALSDR